MDPWLILGKLLLAALYGVVGQLIRLIVGLKKTAAAAPPATSLSNLIDTKRLVVGLGISFAVGAIAGILSSLKIDDIATSKRRHRPYWRRLRRIRLHRGLYEVGPACSLTKEATSESMQSCGVAGLVVGRKPRCYASSEQPARRNAL